jgi:hypothetical protein
MSLIVSFNPADYTDEQVLKWLNGSARRAILRHVECLYAMTFAVPFNGDMAQLAFDNAYDELLEKSWKDFVPHNFWEYYHVAIERELDFDLAKVDKLDDSVAVMTFLEGSKAVKAQRP